jgi:hypothetical protein
MKGNVPVCATSLQMQNFEMRLVDCMDNPVLVVYHFLVSGRAWLRPGTHYRHVTWAHVMSRVQLECERRLNTGLYGAGSHFCHSPHVTWSHLEIWSAHVTARLSHFCCRTHFVRRELREESSSDVVTSCFQKWRKCLLKKCANGPFYMPHSRQIIEHISILMSWTHTFLRTVTASAARIAHTFSTSAS